MKLSVALIVAAVGVAVAAPAHADKTPSLTNNGKVAVDSSKPYPGVLFSDILKASQDQVAWSTGRIRFYSHVRMAFLPDARDPHHIAGYNPGSTGARLVTQFRDRSGKVVSAEWWEARRNKHPWWLARASMRYGKALAPGRYTLHVLIEGKSFWQMPVKVVKAEAAAYSTPRYYFEGLWDKYAYVYVPRGNASSSSSLNLFLRNKASKPGSWKQSKVTVRVTRNGKLIGGYPMSGGSLHRIRPWWERLELGLRGTKKTNYVLRAADLLKKGRYVITVKIDGKHYARYRYRATGKGLPFHRLQKREGTESHRFLEGGLDRFYLARGK